MAKTENTEKTYTQEDQDIIDDLIIQADNRAITYQEVFEIATGKYGMDANDVESYLVEHFANTEDDE